MGNPALTKAERRVFKAYCTEETHELAAKSLDISTQTLKNHLGSIYKKIGRRKAHSALYKLALDAGFDPFSEPSDTETTTHAAGSVSTTLNQPETLTIAGGDVQNDIDEAAN